MMRMPISRAILELKDAGCELVITTGGLSVDPDDVTQNGIRQGRCKNNILWKSHHAGNHVSQRRT